MKNFVEIDIEDIKLVQRINLELKNHCYFTPKYSSDSGKNTEKKSLMKGVSQFIYVTTEEKRFKCNCKKSQCENDYCMCKKFNEKCDSSCKCNLCINFVSEIKD